MMLYVHLELQADNILHIITTASIGSDVKLIIQCLTVLTLIVTACRYPNPYTVYVIVMIMTVVLIPIHCFGLEQCHMKTNVIAYH